MDVYKKVYLIGRRNTELPTGPGYEKMVRVSVGGWVGGVWVAHMHCSSPLSCSSWMGWVGVWVWCGVGGSYALLVPSVLLHFLSPLLLTRSVCSIWSLCSSFPSCQTHHRPSLPPSLPSSFPNNRSNASWTSTSFFPTLLLLLLLLLFCRH